MSNCVYFCFVISLLSFNIRRNDVDLFGDGQSSISKYSHRYLYELKQLKHLII